MNELQLLQLKEDTIDVKYEIQVISNKLVAGIESSEISFVEDVEEDFSEENIAFEFEDVVDVADKLDYQIAAACGLLSGSLSVLWGKKFSLDEAHKWGNQKADELVISFAKKQGYKKDSLEGAIELKEIDIKLENEILWIKLYNTSDLLVSEALVSRGY